jgi:hypothetical protein
MRAQRQVEAVGGERLRRQLRIHVSLLAPPRLVVIEERIHRGHAHALQRVDVRNHVAPHEFVSVPSRLLEHLRCRLLDALAYLGRIELIERVARNDACAAPGGLGVEAGRTVSTAEDAARQIRIGQREHADVLVVRPSPRHDGGEREHVYLAPVRAATTTSSIAWMTAAG